MDDALDLWLLDIGNRDGVVACARSLDDVVIRHIALDGAFQELLDFRGRIHQALRAQAPVPTQVELSRFGTKLFRFLLPKDIGRAYEGFDSNAYVRIHLFSNLAELQSIPWEYLQLPNSVPGPAINRPVVRIVPTLGFAPQRMFGRKHKQKLNVLFISSEPNDQSPISWRADAEVVHEAFPADRFSVDTIENATRGKIGNAFAKRDYHIVHFSGHGTVVDGVGHVVLCLPDSGGTDLVPAPEFAQLLAESKVRLAVLAACDTGSGSFEDDLSLVASALVIAGIPAVVANQAPIPDSTVAAFLEIFYQTLVKTGDVDVSVGQARKRLAVGLSSPGRVVLEWGIPTIYRHVRCAKILRS